MKEHGKQTSVIWDVLQSRGGEDFRIRDVGLNLSSSIVWLAKDQQGQFAAFLGRNNGDIDKLIARIDAMIAAIKARK